MTEALLTTVIVAAIAAAMMPMIVKNADEKAAKVTADDLSAFQAAASAHFQANRTAYESAMADGTGAANICKVGVDPVTGSGGLQANNTTLHTCAIDGTMLKYLQSLPPNIQPNNRYGEQWVAIFRQVYTTVAPIQPTGGVEMLVVSAKVTGGAAAVVADGRRHSEAMAASEMVSGLGGVIPDTDRSTCVAKRGSSVFEACGNGWRVRLQDFISPTELSSFANRLPN